MNIFNNPKKMASIIAQWLDGCDVPESILEAVRTDIQEFLVRYFKFGYALGFIVGCIFWMWVYLIKG